MKKKYLVLLLIVVLALVGCNRNSLEETATAKKDELSTQEPISSNFDLNSTLLDDVVTNYEEPTTVIETDTASAYIPNGETSQLMIDVLLNDAEFTFVQFDEYSIEKVATYNKTLSTFDFKLGEFQEEPVEFGDYRVVDMNGDGLNEVIIDVSSIEALILYIDEGQPYGFIYPWRGVKRIFQSGIAEGAIGGSHLTYRIFNFDGDSFSNTIVAEEDHGEYYVEQKQVSLEQYLEYMDNDKFKEIVPYWTDYEMILTTK